MIFRSAPSVREHLENIYFFKFFSVSFFISFRFGFSSFEFILLIFYSSDAIAFVDRARALNTSRCPLNVIPLHWCMLWCNECDLMAKILDGIYRNRFIGKCGRRHRKMPISIWNRRWHSVNGIAVAIYVQNISRRFFCIDTCIFHFVAGIRRQQRCCT